MKARRVVVTWAQNATPVHAELWRNLLAYCQHHKAELVVVPGRYQNPTSQWTDSARGQEWWCPEVTPFLRGSWAETHGQKKLFQGQRLAVGKNLHIRGDLSIRPTAHNVLAGIEGFTGRASVVVGHPKIQLKTVGVGDWEHPRLLLSTGACTVPNYTVSREGGKGNFHHVLGAVVVEPDGKLFHLRHLHADRDGSFFDLDEHWCTGQLHSWGGPCCLVLGDVHTERADWKSLKAARYLVEQVGATTVVLHDVWDWAGRSHHLKPRHRDVGYEVEGSYAWVAGFLTVMSQLTETVVVVASNHNDHPDRWLDGPAPEDDPINLATWYEWNLVRERYSLPILPALWKHCEGADNVRFLARNESFKFEGIELGYHGDRGTKGSRATLHTWTRLGVRTVVGHAHSPWRFDGAAGVGTHSQMDMGYNTPFDGWLHSDLLIYPGGRRTHVNYINGRYQPKGKG